MVAKPSGHKNKKYGYLSDSGFSDHLVAISGLQIGHREKNSRGEKLKTQEKNSNSSQKLNFSAYFRKFAFLRYFFLMETQDIID